MDERDFYLRFSALRGEIWAFSEHLGALEQQIAFWQEKEFPSLPRQTECAIVDYGDVLADAEWQEHRDRVDYALPRLLRASFVVVLWAAYEAGVNEVAEFLRYLRGRKLRMIDLRGNDFTDRSAKYFAHVLGMSLHSCDEVRERLAVPEAVRHAIAHANGRLTEAAGPL